MKTTPEQRAAWRRIRWQVPQVSRDQLVPGMSRPDIASILDDLDEALDQADHWHERTLQAEADAAALRAVAEAARNAAESDGHAECCNTVLLAEQRGKAEGLRDSDVWDDTECDCAAGRARTALRAALRACEERSRG